MQLPGLLVEYLVNGSCALIWIWILFLIPGLPPPAEMDVTKLDGARIALFLPILYVLGMIVDFLALIAVKLFRDKVLRRREGEDSSVASNAKIMLHSAELGREYIMRSSRDRIARGIFINSVITTIVLTIYYLYPNRSRAALVVLPIGLIFSGLCFGMWYRHNTVTSNYQKLASDALKEKLENQPAPDKSFAPKVG